MDHFSSICNNPLVKNSCVILLMNKIDLFTRKLRQKRIKDVAVFSDYRGVDMCTSDGVNYFLKKFKNQVKERTLHHYVTNLLDTDSASQVIVKCKGVIESRNREIEGSCGSDGDRPRPPVSSGTLTLDIVPSFEKNIFRTKRSPDPKSCTTMYSQSSSAHTSQKTLRNSLQEWDPELQRRFSIGRQQTASTYFSRQSLTDL